MSCWGQRLAQRGGGTPAPAHLAAAPTLVHPLHRASDVARRSPQRLTLTTMIPDIANDPEWAAGYAAIDRAFAGSARPDHFTEHTHCCGCSDSDAFFQSHTPESFGVLPDPIETLPVAFLTEDAFATWHPVSCVISRVAAWAITWAKSCSTSRTAGRHSARTNARPSATSFTWSTNAFTTKSTLPPSTTRSSGASSMPSTR